MRTLKYNGEFWYEDTTALWARVLTWVFWMGGPSGNRTPISLFGHFVTFYDWGMDVRTPEGRLVVSWLGLSRDIRWRSKPAEVYISKDGTPGRAHIWIVGASREIINLANKHKGKRRVFRNWENG